MTVTSYGEEEEKNKNNNKDTAQDNMETPVIDPLTIPKVHQHVNPPTMSEETTQEKPSQEKPKKDASEVGDNKEKSTKAPAIKLNEKNADVGRRDQDDEEEDESEKKYNEKETPEDLQMRKTFTNPIQYKKSGENKISERGDFQFQVSRSTQKIE